VPLARFQGPAAPILEQCRQRIEEQSPPDERANLLAVSQVLARLRYNDAKLLGILGGTQVMIESPLIQEIVAKSKQQALRVVLQARFGSVPAEVTERLRAVDSERKLEALIKHAVRCADLQAFLKRLPK